MDADHDPESQPDSNPQPTPGANPGSLGGEPSAQWSPAAQTRFQGPPFGPPFWTGGAPPRSAGTQAGLGGAQPGFGGAQAGLGGAQAGQGPEPAVRRALRRRHRVGVTVAATAAALGTGIAAGLGLGSLTAGSPVSTASHTTSVSAITSKVDPELVDVYSTLGYEGAESEGTGIVLTANGEILTNNHVVEGATSINVVDVGNGRTYTADVVGYDTTVDLAVLQLNGASGLATVSLGNSSKLSVGQAVVAIGNAGGVGGTPSFSTGSVAQLDASITAQDDATGGSENLTGLIGTNATLEAGDSGGPLVNMSGQVVGVDVAATSGFQLGSTSQSYSIPINEALTVASEIESGAASSTVHVGGTAFIGVETQPASAFGLSGAEVAGVVPGSPASATGLTSGDVITSVNGQSISSPTSLGDLIEQLKPGERVTLGWTDTAGASHTSAVVLASGPPA